MSFRNRLALFLMATLICVQAATAIFAYIWLRHDLVEQGKRELASSMQAFARQLDFLSDRVTDRVEVLALDYALRAAIARRDHDTELSALRNHGRRIGAARMILVGLDGEISVDTAAPARSKTTGADRDFPLSQLLQDAAAQNRGTALVTLGGAIYWIAVVPVRAPVPIAFIAAWIPVNGVLLDEMRQISSSPHAIVLATMGENNRWTIAAHTADYPAVGLPSVARPTATTAIVAIKGHDFLTATAPLQTAPGSRPVVAILDFPLDEALAAYRGLITPMLIVLGLALLAAAGGATLIVRHSTRPLEILAAAARRIAAGDYTHPPKIDQKGEVGHLALALTNMMGSIAEREAALKSAVASAELARAEAVRANEAKSQFLANMSHELRTPLNAIVGFSEMLEQQVLGPIGMPRYVEYARDIRASGERLRLLFEHMLALAEAEPRDLGIAHEPLSIGSLLRHAVDIHRNFAETARVRALLPRDLDDWPAMCGDAAKLGQAFSNLIHNAIKFTPQGGTVTISGIPANESFAIAIADSGIGIDPQSLGAILRPFHRLRSALDGQHQGAGLGLPYAKIIVELHGGTLSVSSTPGEGTVVSVELPVAAGAISHAA